MVSRSLACLVLTNRRKLQEQEATNPFNHKQIRDEWHALMFVGILTCERQLLINNIQNVSVPLTDMNSLLIMKVKTNSAS